MGAVANFLASMKAPRLAELRCSEYLALASWNAQLAKKLAAGDEVLLDDADWKAAIDYAKRHGIEVTDGN